jgi:DNA-binding CsgD family transcriptional regulator
VVERAKRARIETLLRAGCGRSEIAREVGVSASTVTRYARLCGVPDVAPRRSETDWAAVQRFYDLGHTIDECRARFGFSYGGWDKAVTRGDLVPRRRRNGELAGGTRDRVEHLLAGGMNQTQIARELDVSKSTVAYHVRALGIRADPKFARRHEWAVVQKAIDEEGLSMTQCMRRFGFFRDTWYRAVRRGDVVPRPHQIPLDELLVVGREKTNRSHLKRRLVKAGLKEDRCEICGITEWLGRPLNMELHHVNGDGLDNRLENLQLLCGNCHSQTDNWGGRGGRRKPVQNG